MLEHYTPHLVFVNSVRDEMVAIPFWRLIFAAKLITWKWTFVRIRFFRSVV